MIRDELVATGNDGTLIDTWYRKDSNAVPPISVLQPISSILINFNNKVTFFFIETAANNHIVSYFAKQLIATRRDANIRYGTRREYSIWRAARKFAQNKNLLKLFFKFSKRIPKLQAEDQAVWWDTLGKFQKLFRKASSSLYQQGKMDKDAMHNYFMSGNAIVSKQKTKNKNNFL